MVKYFSGLIRMPEMESGSDFDKFKRKLDSVNNLKKIEALPPHISEKILALPQFEIFFEDRTPYYTVDGGEKTELPKGYNDFYHDPVEDTEVFKLVINEVRALAQKEYEDEIIKRFGTKRVMGGVHIYYSTEAKIMYEKYGITYINNPTALNLGLHID